MSWTRIFRRLSLLPWTALLVTAVGCGGGDKSPTGPGGDGPGGGDISELRLISLGRAGLPADAQLEDCTLTRFYSGAIQIDRATGDWQLTLKVHDANLGDWGYRDGGQTEVDGQTVWFDSEVTGNSFEGTVDNTGVAMMYDWCEDGVADVQLVFIR
jgi:hypothetical protein